MGLISKIFRRNDAEIQQDVKNQLVVSAAHGEMARQDTEIDVKWRELLGIRHEVLHDDSVDDMLEQKCLKAVSVPEFDKKGNLVFQRDTNGKICVDGNGNPIVKYKQAYVVDNTFAALRTMISHVNRCTFLDPKNTRLVQLVMEDIIEDAKMNLPEKDFDLGLGSYLDSLWNHMFFLTNDAQNGNKVKALLEIRTIKSLDVNTMQKEKKGVF